MKAIHLLLICIATLLGTSCQKGSEPIIDTESLHFLPRECRYMFFYASSMETKTENGGPYSFTITNYVNLSDEQIRNGIDYSQLVVSISAAGKEYDYMLDHIAKHGEDAPFDNILWLYDPQYLAEPFEIAEKEMEYDYKLRATTRSADNELAYDVLLYWEYFVTGVRDLDIIALTPLFGQPAETSLRKYFTIQELDPRHVISYKSQHLVYGYRDKKELKNIDQWLTLAPTVQPRMRLRLNTRPSELPVETQLVSILTTVEGSVFRDTINIKIK